MPSYRDNGDSTITDTNTGLIWQKYMGEKISYTEAVRKAETMTLGGHDDWRIPTIKELYSLILFTGRVKGQTAINSFIDTAYFDQPLGDVSAGERQIDAQTWSSTHYTGKTMKGDSAIFGVNFIDGRIKGYPAYHPVDGTPNRMYFRMVRGNPEYGMNNFTDNGDGTVTDLATGLMWQRDDDGVARNWEEALSYAEELELAGYADWHLPSAKELQSIVDYSRCPDATNSPAIDPVFGTTEITDPDGKSGQYPYFWTGTSHLDGVSPFSNAVYIAFGEAQGKMNGVLMDVHGAGAQRSDPKSGSAELFPDFHGPQGDVRYVYNYVRCVRRASGPAGNTGIQPEDDESRIYYDLKQNRVYVKFGSVAGSTINIYSMTGKMEMAVDCKNQSHCMIDINNLQAGMYLISIFAAGTGVKTEKIIKP
jgi:hypothetical protein